MRQKTDPKSAKTHRGGHPFITFSPVGRGVQNQQRLREFSLAGTRGIQNPENVGSVISGCPLTPVNYEFVYKTLF